MANETNELKRAPETEREPSSARRIAHIQVSQEGAIETFFYGEACDLPPGGYDLHLSEVAK